RYDQHRKLVAELLVLVPHAPPDGDDSPRRGGLHAESIRDSPAGPRPTAAPDPAPPAKEHTMGHRTPRIADGLAPRRHTVIAEATRPRPRASQLARPGGSDHRSDRMC